MHVRIIVRTVALEHVLILVILDVKVLVTVPVQDLQLDQAVVLPAILPVKEHVLAPQQALAAVLLVILPVKGPVIVPVKEPQNPVAHLAMGHVKEIVKDPVLEVAALDVLLDVQALVREAVLLGVQEVVVVLVR